jgi:hypothetical protein
MRAKQATEFVNGRGGTAFVGKNPFAGLSRDQLALIMYDQGNAFTVNERRAALHEYNAQRSLWSQKVCAQAQMEQATTNTFTNFYKACIAEYQEGSLIEQATYPENYVSRMEYYIKLWEGGGGGVEMEPMDLLQMVLEQLRRFHGDEDTSTRLFLPKSRDTTET